MKIGILALQGDYEKHRHIIEALQHETVYVKDRKTLAQCDKLIIPGGESTTFLHLIEALDMRRELMEFGKTKAIMGTCAGLILLGNSSQKLPYNPLQLIDIEVNRNAYGRQVDSFIDDVRLNIDDKERIIEGVFIRAPKIAALGNHVRPLGYHKDDVVVAANDRILVSTFHPELSGEKTIHQFFIDKIG